MGRRTRRRGIGLVEVLVALVVLAVGIGALQRLVVQSITALAADADLTTAMLTARALLAEAEVRPPEPGAAAGTRAGLAFDRVVAATPAAALREVRVRVYPTHGAPCELVELVHVATP